MDQYRPYLDLNDAVRLIIFMIKNPKSFNRRIFNAVTNHATPRMVLREISRHQRNLKVNRIHSKAMNQISYKVSVEPLLKTGFRFRGGFEKSIPAILSVFA